MRLIDRGGWYAAENAVILGDVRVAREASVWYGAVVRGDMAPITIGEWTNLQDNCVLHCDPGEDMVVGRHVTVGHMAMIHAQAVGDFSLIGIGSILLNGCKVGERCIIGAGAVVKQGQEIPPGSIVVGVPGRIIGQTDAAFVEEARQRAMRYQATARRHVDGKVDPKFMKEYAPGEKA
jgi:carbonic anhydrase/acetyltransferase-like protein (isoleucine patch superfamily)